MVLYKNILIKIKFSLCTNIVFSSLLYPVRVPIVITELSKRRYGKKCVSLYVYMYNCFYLSKDKTPPQVERQVSYYLLLVETYSCLYGDTVVQVLMYNKNYPPLGY